MTESPEMKLARLPRHESMQTRAEQAKTRRLPADHGAESSLSNRPLEGRVRELTAKTREQALLIQDLKVELGWRERCLERMERVSTLSPISAGLAHELSQPLTALAGSLELARLSLRETSSERGRATRDLVERAANLSELVIGITKRMRTLVRNHEMQRVVASFEQVIIDSVALLQTRLDHANIDLLMKLAKTEQRLSFDPVLVTQVVLNIVGNAIEAHEGAQTAAPRIEVVTESHVDHVVLQISDNGPGCDESALASLFEPFFTTKSSGTGFGMWISRRIVEQHHGHIDACNNSSGGMTWRVRIPHC